MLKYIAIAGASAMLAGAASPPPRVPQAGVIRESDQTLRPLLGIPSNLIVGEALPFTNVLRSSFSNEAGLVLTSQALKLVSVAGKEIGSFPTVDADAVLGISNGPETAVAWLPREQKLLHWTGQWSEVPLDGTRLPGRVRDVQYESPDAVTLLTEDTSGSLLRVRVPLAAGGFTSISPAGFATGDALLAQHAIVWETNDGFSVRCETGNTIDFPLSAGDLSLERASSEFIHIAAVSGNGHWLLHLTPDAATLSEIPAPRGAQ